MKLRRSTFLGVLGAAPFAAALPASAQAPKIRIAYIPSDGGGEPYYVQEEGFFSKAGLDVEVLPFTNSLRMIEAIVGGSLDVGTSADPITMANAFLRGIPIVAFAGQLVYSSTEPTFVLCAAKNGPVKTPKDLEGQVLGTPSLTGVVPVAAQAWIEQRGADYSKIKLFELPFPQLAPAIDRGTVAAAMDSEPFVTLSRDTIQVIGKPFDVFGRSHTLGMWFASRDWATRNLEVVRRLTGAIYDGARWCNTHRADSLDILVKMTKLDPDRIRGMNRALFATSFEPNDIQTVLDLAIKYKALERPVAGREFIIPLR